MKLLGRSLIIAMAAVVAALALAACGGGGESKAGAELSGAGEKPAAGATSATTEGGAGAAKLSGTLRVMAEHEVLEGAILKPFEQANPGLSIETAEIEGSSEAATKLSAGFSTDVVETCADEIRPLLQRELLAPLETSRLSHWNELYSGLRSAPGVTVNGRQMFVPLQAGPQGLIYNTEAFPHGVESIKELFNPALQGKVAMEGDDHSMIAMAAFSLGIKEPFNMSAQDLNKVGRYLLAHANQFRAFPKSDANMLNLMKSKEVVLMDGGLGTAQEMIAGGVPVKWVKPKEGYYSWVCGLAVTKNAQNVNAAYALLNYYSSAQAQARFGNEGYVVLNQNAIAKVKPSNRKFADPASLSGAVVEQEPSDKARWSEIYQEVVAG